MIEYLLFYNSFLIANPNITHDVTMPNIMEQQNHHKLQRKSNSRTISSLLRQLFCRETDAEIWLPDKTLWLPDV